MSFGLVFEGSSACLDWILGKLCLPHAAIPASIFTSLPMPGHQNQTDRNALLLHVYVLCKTTFFNHQRVHFFYFSFAKIELVHVKVKLLGSFCALDTPALKLSYWHLHWLTNKIILPRAYLLSLSTTHASDLHHPISLTN